MNFDPKTTLFLIDGSSFLYRAYYGTRPLHTPTGEPVQAVYSFCRMIRKLIDRFQPKHLALVWDSPGKTERHEEYAEYKAGRDDAPSDIFDQKERITEFAELIDLAQVARDGVEADDLMFSLARDWTQKGGTAVFVTSDKDMGQAISDCILLFDPFKDAIIDADAFEAKMGFPVAKLPFYFSLVGDTSDNIPGVRGIGAKGATELVQQFDSLEDMYAHLDNVAKPRLKNALEAGKKNAFLSRDLFLLRYHTLTIDPQTLSFDETKWHNALPLFKELAFKSLMGAAATVQDRAALHTQKIERVRAYGFQAVTTHAQLTALCEKLVAAGAFAIDTETDGVQPLQVNLVGISFCMKEGEAYYVPCGHQEGEQIPRQEVIHVLRPILQDPDIKKYLHNAKFDQLVLSAHGIELQGVAFDSMIAANIIKEDWQRVGLKFLSQFYFDEPMLSCQETLHAHKSPNFSYVPIDLAVLYSGHDAHQTFRLAQRLMRDLGKNKTLSRVYYEIEHPLIQVLYRMEREGIYLDPDYLKALDKPVSLELKRIDEEIADYVGATPGTLNFNSPKQMQELLFETLGLPPQKKSAKKTGYSTDQEVLSELAKQHPIPGLIITYRELFKLKSTYLDALPQYINPRTKRVHTTFSQIAVATGRLASSDPNLQNIPVGGASGFGIQVRAAFKPTSGNVFVSADYSQIELRVLAQLSGDEHLIQAFCEGHDIHAQTAARLFEVAIADVSHKQRQLGKRINFSILYGLTPYGLSKDLDISLSDAKRYIEKYFHQYPGVSRWMEEVIAQTKEQGYVTTLGGRRRYIPAIYEKNRVLYEEARRVAINSKAQGTAAEIMKQGMITLDELFREQQCDARLLLQIHDELLVSCQRSCASEIESIMRNTLESVVSWKVPLVVSTRVGNNWKEVSK